MHTKNIQKTLIFVNTMAKILFLVKTIKKQIKQLKYSQRSGKQIWFYFFTMLDLNKAIDIKAFKLNSKINTKSTIFVATNAYEIKINNLNIKLVI